MTKIINLFSLKDCDQKEKIRCILMYIAIAILVIADIIMGFTFAKYVAKSSPAGDSARVAKFDVSITDRNDSALTDGSLDIDFGKSDDASATYGFKVSNNSEVAAEYSLVLTMKDKYDTETFALTVETEGGTEITHSEPETVKVSGTNQYRYTFPCGVIDMGSEAEGSLKFALKSGKDVGMTATISDVDLEVVVSQID